jgi:hypothetical protein
MQEKYISAHEEAMKELDAELERVWEQITGPNTLMPLVLTIMIAKEFTEWGRLVNSVAETAYTKNWSIPTLSGAVSSSVDRPEECPCVTYLSMLQAIHCTPYVSQSSHRTLPCALLRVDSAWNGAVM